MFKLHATPPGFLSRPTSRRAQDDDGGGGVQLRQMCCCEKTHFFSVCLSDETEVRLAGWGGGGHDMCVYVGCGKLNWEKRKHSILHASTAVQIIRRQEISDEPGMGGANAVPSRGLPEDKEMHSIRRWLVGC